MINIFNKISSQERVDFAKNLSVMLKGGISINEVLGLLADQTKSKSFEKILRRMRREIEMGSSFAGATEKYRSIFGDVFVGMVKAGEASGTLEDNLIFVATWLERNNDLKEEVKSATLYPKFVLWSAVFMALGLSAYVLPKLVPLFTQLKVELPLPTRILMAFSAFLQQWWFLAIAGLGILIVAFKMISSIKPVRFGLDWFYLRLPFASGLIIDYQLALISQLLATLLKSGLPISSSLEITSEAATNSYYKKSIGRICSQVNKGMTMSRAMGEYPSLYPRNLISIVATGEKSGALDESFVHLSDYYSSSIRHKAKRLPTAIEPILLLLIAVGVGFIAIAIIMPIYQLTRGISH